MASHSAEVERLIFHMPAIASQAEDRWAIGFARSIQRQAKRPGWKPSPKQLAIMRRLVSELFTISGDFDAVDLADPMGGSR